LTENLEVLYFVGIIQMIQILNRLLVANSQVYIILHKQHRN